MNSGPVKRRYNATRRHEQARLLRLDVAVSARRVFIERGYAASTIGDIAEAAGVSPQFVFKAFGNKAGLLARVIDWTLVGDDEPVPMSQRPSILAIQQEASIAGKCALYARHGRLVAGRIAGTLAMLRAAADADADARAIYETGEAQRRTGARLFVGNVVAAGPLRPGLTPEEAADALWALSPDILWTTLVTRAGWSPEQFEFHYAGLIAASVLEDEDIPAVRRFSQELLAVQPTEP